MGEFIEANNVHEDVCYRKTLNPLTQILIPEVEFHRPPKANESDRLSIKKTRDTTIHLVEKKSSVHESLLIMLTGHLLLQCLCLVGYEWWGYMVATLAASAEDAEEELSGV